MPIRNSRRLLAAGSLVAIVAVGIWMFRSAAPESRPGPLITASANPKAKGPAATLPAPPLPSAPLVATPAITSSTGAAAESIDAILTNPALDNTGAALALAALVQDRKLGEDARGEALAHLLNLSAGDEPKLLLPVLNSPHLPDTLAATILSDALNGPFTWQADACLAVMARPAGRELHAQAREHLAFLVGADHGEDLKAWTLALSDLRAKWAEESR